MAYGEYASSGRCLGKCLYQLSKIGIPLHIVETVVFDNLGHIEYCSKPFATYQWLHDDTPVFKFYPMYAAADTYTQLQAEWFRRNKPEPMELSPVESKSADVRTEQEFLDKWASIEIAYTFGAFWTKTPSRLYWCLAFELPEERLRECAKDLVAVSPDEYNTSVLHAKQLLDWST